MTVALSNTPVLETERLILRTPIASDSPAYEAFAASPRARYLGGPITPFKAWRSFGHAIGHWVLHGWGSFVFQFKNSDRPLGVTGPWSPRGWPEKEIGWDVWHDDVEGTGTAFEAASRVRDFVFQDLGWDTAVSYIDAPDLRSIALAKRLGAVHDPDAKQIELDKGDHPVLVYRHPAPGVPT